MITITQKLLRIADVGTSQPHTWIKSTRVWNSGNWISTNTRGYVNLRKASWQVDNIGLKTIQIGLQIIIFVIILSCVILSKLIFLCLSFFDCKMTNFLPPQGYFKNQVRLKVLSEYLEGSKHLINAINANSITIYFQSSTQGSAEP